jgi:hypothetical protein
MVCNCVKFFFKTKYEEAHVIPVKDETMLSIGMISMALGILIGRFVHLEYSGFLFQIFWKESLLDYPLQ